MKIKSFCIKKIKSNLKSLNSEFSIFTQVCVWAEKIQGVQNFFIFWYYFYIFQSFVSILRIFELTRKTHGVEKAKNSVPGRNKSNSRSNFIKSCPTPASRWPGDTIFHPFLRHIPFGLASNLFQIHNYYFLRKWFLGGWGCGVSDHNGSMRLWSL